MDHNMMSEYHILQWLRWHGFYKPGRRSNMEQQSQGAATGKSL